MTNALVKPQPKFERRDAGYRRDRLIHAAIACISDIGYAAATVREICKRAEVSPGLLRHYFDGKAELVMAAYSQTLASFLGGVRDTIGQPGLGPREKLELFVEACFSTTNDPDNRMAMMLAFWSELRLHPEIRAQAADMFDEYRRELVTVIEAVALAEGNQDEVDPMLVATSLTSLIDGLWLEMSIAPDRFRIRDAKLACYGLLDGFLFCGTNEQWLQERAAGRY